MDTEKKPGTVWDKIKSSAQKSFGRTLFISYLAVLAISVSALFRSEERRVGKECT